ncbi:PRC-barrel domain-containing protein [Aquicoccus sp. G2-2]|jgi:sporulation protein YlmC with PRC-barrel domain|uniref:PRC-barrel domain-containing protein n=1 Tax=Aquicoccus sp. G2-2 TaxID=3092120 RepID=UPI002ADF6DCC|nr:PRC-barrel domain-containing protein [Aquicoccus sp. G2-2]MEA1115299.1 PRC-barrel domain-containing protein [Aquicoccus sp. G2-2]
MNTSSNSSLVSSSDVNGTEVYGRDGSKIGSVDHLMIDKESGNIAYAVMGFGGFLGVGEEHQPVPWAKLSYDTDKNGFVTDIVEADVQDAPERQDNWYNDRDWERRAYEHYHVAPYWL